MDAIAVTVRRGSLVEAVHRVHAVAVEDGRITESAGDPGLVTFYRSSSKPLQALPLARLLPAIDLVVCDVGLPRCSGVELVRRLREERDDVAVLYVTGHAEATTARLGLGDEEPCLRKPFSPAELLAAVAAMVPS